MTPYRWSLLVLLALLAIGVLLIAVLPSEVVVTDEGEVMMGQEAIEEMNWVDDVWRAGWVSVIEDEGDVPVEWRGAVPYWRDRPEGSGRIDLIEEWLTWLEGRPPTEREIEDGGQLNALGR